MEIVRRTPNGMLAYCAKCQFYHLEFGNFLFQFTPEEFEKFKAYLDQVNGEHYEALNRDLPNNRKIFLRLPLACVYCALYLTELYELRSLVDPGHARQPLRCIRPTEVGDLHIN